MGWRLGAGVAGWGVVIDRRAGHLQLFRKEVTMRYYFLIHDLSGKLYDKIMNYSLFQKYVERQVIFQEF